MSSAACAVRLDQLDQSDHLRIGSAERKYTAVRRAQQAAARVAWRLASAENFRAITKRLIRGVRCRHTRPGFNDVLVNKLAPARNAVRRITA